MTHRPRIHSGPMNPIPWEIRSDGAAVLRAAQGYGAIISEFEERRDELAANAKLGLNKISHPGLEDRLVFVAGDVFGDLGCGAFGVGHFAQDPSAGAGDALDGGERAVRVDRDIHRRDAVRIAVLGGDLAGLGEFGDDRLAGEKPTFAVGDGEGVDIAGFHLRHPG